MGEAMTVMMVLGGLLVVIGLIGCVVPVIPGPPISYIALILLSFAYHWKAFTPFFLVIMGLLTVVATVLDFILPVYVPKRVGGSKYGVWGSILGMFAGMIFFPPFGLIIGTLAGAVLAELIFNENKKAALKAGLGVFVGTIGAIIVKIAVSGVIGYYFFRAVIRGPHV